MTIQQLRYAAAIAEHGSISLAARRMFVSQPAMTGALRELEQEVGRPLFFRNARGVSLTEEGVRFLGYAKAVLQQMALLEEAYRDGGGRRYFSVSTQHYTFAARAFSETIRAYAREAYTFSLLEERTDQVIADVMQMKSELGILYMSRWNEAALSRILRENRLTFTPLFAVRPHVVLAQSHPLAGKTRLPLAALEAFPCIVFDQGEADAVCFSEEMFDLRLARQTLHVTDRAAAAQLLLELDAYLVATGDIPSWLRERGLAVRRLDADEPMTVGVIRRRQTKLSAPGRAFLDALRKTAQEIEAKEER